MAANGHYAGDWVKIYMTIHFNANIRDASRHFSPRSTWHGSEQTVLLLGGGLIKCEAISGRLI